MQSAHQATEFLHRDTTPSQSPHADAGLQKVRQPLRVGQAASQNAQRLVQLDLLSRSRAIEMAICGDQEQHFQQQ